MEDYQLEEINTLANILGKSSERIFANDCCVLSSSETMVETRTRQWLNLKEVIEGPIGNAYKVPLVRIAPYNDSFTPSYYFSDVTFVNLGSSIVPGGSQNIFPTWQIYAKVIYSPLDLFRIENKEVPDWNINELRRLIINRGEASMLQFELIID